MGKFEVLEGSFRFSQWIARAGGQGLLLVVLAAVLLVVGGCKTSGDKSESVQVIDLGPPPSYESVVARYNANTKHLDQVWARAVVRLRWEEDNGKRKSEQGEGYFIIQKPHNVALNIGKLGDTYVWLGSNEQDYFLFDLLNDPKTLLIGDRQAAALGQSPPFGVPIYPQDVFGLMGTLPLLELGGHVEWTNDTPARLLLEPPGGRIRMIVDAERFLPQRIDLLDEQGVSFIICELSQHERVTIDGLSPGAYPFLASRVEIRVVGEYGGLRLTLNGLTDGVETNRIRDRAFDLDFLRRRFEVEQVIDLDEDRS